MSSTTVVLTRRQLLELPSFQPLGARGPQPLGLISAKKNAEPEPKKKSFEEIMAKAGKSALRGGIPGMISMCVQVLGLMWMRTTMNYQYANGLSTMQALKTLYADGGIPRFYKGLAPALIQGPLSRFGDTAANAGMLALLEGSSVPIFVQTFAASGGAAFFRVFLMPVDTLKTYMQVNGAQALPMLGAKIKAGGPLVLYAGSFAALAATWVGHYPWFVTHNYLNAKLPRSNVMWRKLARSALIGWCSSFVSDVVSNSIRVLKTKTQTSTENINMMTALKQVLKEDGVKGLFTRGLGTKLVCNGIQGVCFTVVWKLLEEEWAKKDAEAEKAMKNLPKKGETVKKTK